MRFVRSILALSFVSALGVVAYGQTEPKAYKFAEFGRMSQADVKEKMDGFLIEFAKNPSAQGYVVNYGSAKAIAARRKQITNSMTFLRLDPSRITFVDRSGENKVRTIMWIVPPGTTPPSP
jgi:hypothetical protein